MLGSRLLFEKRSLCIVTKIRVKYYLLHFYCEKYMKNDKDNKYEHWKSPKEVDGRRSMIMS